jgi:hypothetical protein
MKGSINMIKLFNNEQIIMDNKIKWKNLPGKDKHEIFRTFITEYNKKFDTLLEYQYIDAAFIDYITERAYYIDKNNNKYYIYHKNDFGRRIKTPYFKKYYKKRVDREGFNKGDFYGYDKKPETQLIKLSVNENEVLYQVKYYNQYKRCLVTFVNGTFDEIIFMKDGFRKNGIEPLDFKTKVKLGKNNKLYNKIKEMAIKDYKGE